MRVLKSLKFRLTVVYAGIFAAFLTAFSGALYGLASSRAWREFDLDLHRDARAYASLVAEEWRELKEGEHSAENWLDELKTVTSLLHASVTLTGTDGTVIYESDREAPEPPMPGEAAAQFRTEPGPAGTHREVTLDLWRNGGPPLVLRFSRSTGGLSQFLTRTRIGLVTAIPILVGLAFVAGYYFIRRTIRPVEVMAGLAREISAGDLGRRVPLPDSEGEFRRLALTLNDMLQRLEESFRRLKTFTSNAAHELRTPVAAMRSALETSLGRSPQDMEESIRDALEELARLTEITDKLLLLARADAGRLLGAVGPLDLAEMAAQVREALEAPAREKEMSISVEGSPGAVTGDPALIRRALHNLAENAVKYGRRGGTVRIRLESGGFAVENDGPVIDPRHLPRLFDRFFRIDTSRSDRVPGSGLGLAIVKSIAEAHGGAVAAESAAGRTLFRVTIPSDETAPFIDGNRGAAAT